MYCNKCGLELMEGDSFCSNCGNKAPKYDINNKAAHFRLTSNKLIEYFKNDKKFKSNCIIISLIFIFCIITPNNSIYGKWESTDSDLQQIEFCINQEYYIDDSFYGTFKYSKGILDTKYLYGRESSKVNIKNNKMVIGNTVFEKAGLFPSISYLEWIIISVLILRLLLLLLFKNKKYNK